ncbi:putative L-ascorbate peroxidase 6 [Platanthera zijinensis]|uniref:L-ascorbate peroxidase 6 n=1 Tax=Platanthera zijinensis TaxID=2320716 RepID=A0AAP0BBZ4_9ASPA
MWTASSLPSLSYKQHQQPLLPPPSTPYTVSCLAPPSISGTAEYHCLGRRPRSKTWVGTIVQCSIGTPNPAPAFCPLTKPSRRLLPEMDDRDCRDSHGSCCFTSSGRRRLLFMSLISLLHPPRTLAETLDAAKLLTIRNSLRAVLSKAKAAGMLRMAFHDAGTYDLKDHTGGMNGSIIYELDRPENTGLNKSVKILAKVKEEVNKIHQVSWADLIAVAGAEAVVLCGGPSIPVKIGRVDVRISHY